MSRLLMAAGALVLVLFLTAIYLSRFWEESCFEGLERVQLHGERYDGELMAIQDNCGRLLGHLAL